METNCCFFLFLQEWTETKSKQNIQHSQRALLRSKGQTHKLKQKPDKKKQKKNISIKVMQIYLPIRPQTGFHGDEMATSNWLDEKEACI